MHGCEFVKDLFQNSSFRHTGCDAQVSGSCVLYHKLVLFQLL